ncbi:unnamed protein product [Rotaria magnacalcarata]
MIYQNVKNDSSNLEPIMIKGILGNYEPKNLVKIPGPGENGEGVSLKDGEEKQRGEKSVDDYGFNEVASEKISLDRHARDTKPKECWSTLVRTFHSVINTSPKELLKDIILVDDYSDKEHITVRLPEYIKKWNGLAKYVRTKQRVGLVEARAAQGDVIVIDNSLSSPAII